MGGNFLMRNHKRGIAAVPLWCFVHFVIFAGLFAMWPSPQSASDSAVIGVNPFTTASVTTAAGVVQLASDGSVNLMATYVCIIMSSFVCINFKYKRTCLYVDFVCLTFIVGVKPTLQ